MYLKTNLPDMQQFKVTVEKFNNKNNPESADLQQAAHFIVTYTCSIAYRLLYEQSPLSFDPK